MPGARCTRSLACKIKKHTSIVTTVTPKSSGIPRAMVLTVSFVLFPVIGLGCHRRLRNDPRKLDASVEASEPHDFAVRLTRCSSAAHQRPSHPAPRFVTLRNAPRLEQDQIAIPASRLASSENFGNSEIGFQKRRDRLDASLRQPYSTPASWGVN